MARRNLSVAYTYREWEKFGELFAEHWKEANQAVKLSMLRDLLCCYRDTRAQASVLSKCDLR